GSYMYKLRKPFLFGPVGGGQTAPPAFKAYFRNEWKFEVIRDLIGWFYQRFNPACYNTLKQAALVLVSNKETFDAIKNVRQKKETIYELDTALARDFSPETFPERETRSKMRILWVGRIFSRKGLELVFQSLQKVDARKCDYTLDIVGHGPWEHYIEEWKHQYGIADRVTWHGKLPYAEVKRFYKEADVFIFTSLRDAVGVQLLEAMAWGLPIVTLDMHGGGLLISPDYGIKVPPTTPEETTFKIAEAVQWLYDHPLERTEMGRRGFDFAKTLNWDAKTDKMIDTYKSTLEKQAKQ
nr:glycosyltransferase [Cytophagales bacterium]